MAEGGDAWERYGEALNRATVEVLGEFRSRDG
jgi:hypothetical protein